MVRKALEAGHQVTAYVRNAAKLGETKAQVVVGELSDVAAISRAIAGHDAVISLLGPASGNKGMPISTGMQHIVGAMKSHGARRLIATATPSATDAADGKAAPFSFAVRLVKTFAGKAYRDVVALADVVRATSLEWTLVRLPMLSNKKTSKPVAVGYIGDPAIRLFSASREAVAQFVVEQLRDRTWLRKSPVISNGR